MDKMNMEQTPSINESQPAEQSHHNNLPSNSSLQTKKLLMVIGIIFGFILFGVGGYLVGIQQGSLKNTSEGSNENVGDTDLSPTLRPTSVPVVQTNSASMSVVVRENEQDNTKSDIYLKDDGGKETFFITLTDIYRNHYHNAEYHNGNLYIIHRTGGDMGYQDNPNWTDSLWRYGADKQGVKLYAVQGLDFRVSDDEKYIVIITNDSFDLLDSAGNKIKTFAASVVISNPESSPMFGFLSWGKDSVWLDNTFGPSLTGVTNIDLTTYAVTTYDLSELPAGPEYALNPTKELIAFSNYPALFDVDSAEDYEQSGSKVNLIVYDLNNKTQKTISTSTTKRFTPRWIDESTLEYDNPNGEGKLTTQI